MRFTGYRAQRPDKYGPPAEIDPWFWVDLTGGLGVVADYGDLPAYSLKQMETAEYNYRKGHDNYTGRR